MSDRQRLLMTPGPTEVPRRVRERMAEPILNPDVQPEFAPFYRSLTEKLADVYRTDDDVVVLGGEGILGLEASVASVIEEGDTVLCVSNGVYGDGFADFVELYGGDPVRCGAPYTEPIDVERVKEAVEEHDVAAATMVHCETPTGALNDLGEVLATLSDAGALTIVDAVSSLGGTPVPTDDIDVCIGGSQKCLSSPPGLATLSVSDDAWGAVGETDTPAFYADLAPWEDAAEEGWFPYTHLVSNLAALDESVDVLLEEGVEGAFERHRDAAAYCRERVRELGLDLYPPEELSSPTVTAIHLDERATSIQEAMAGEGVVVATSLGDLSDDVLRIGHMGYNADRERVERTMDALEAALE